MTHATRRPRGLDRREWMALLSGTAVLGACGGGGGLAASGGSGSSSSTLVDPVERERRLMEIRDAAAAMARSRGVPAQGTNGDETSVVGRLASMTKGLPHDADGVVDPQAWDALIQGLIDATMGGLDAVPLGGTRRFPSPLAGLAFALEGGDPTAFAMPAPPAMRSAELAAEMTELYWMALARDLPFERYGTDPLIADAARELGALSGYRGPTTANGSIAPEQLFRGGAAGCLTGPYLSQFMLQGMRFGTVSVDLRQQTLRQGLDYMSDPAEWLAILRGNPAANGPSFEATERYPITLRDLAAYVRVDELYQAYLLAALRLVDLGVPMAPGFDAYQLSPSCEGYVTFGNKHVLGLVAEVAQRALAAVWYSKWFVHRRARPEILGGRVEWQRRGRLAAGLHPDLMQSEAVRRTLAAKGSALLPQAYPDGAPLHPSYGAGHATVAAACTAVLKAVFDPSTPIQNPVVPDSAGTNLLPYTGPDANALTVGGELDKLAANISLGRNAAGIHYRSDHEQSSLLGERIAAAFLGERSLVYREAHRFEFPSVSGSIIRM